MANKSIDIDKHEETEDIVFYLGATIAAKRLNVLNSTLYRWRSGEVRPPAAKFQRMKEIFDEIMAQKTGV